MASKKQNYEMVDGIPLWQHLKNGATKGECSLRGTDYGRLAEIIGKRILVQMTREDGILNKIFPGISILSTKRVREGDFALQIDYKNMAEYGKKIVIFEIKHGMFHIEQNQIRRYCETILAPYNYYKKADEARVFFLLFSKIDTLGCKASYSLKELDKGLAAKITDSSEARQKPPQDREQRIGETVRAFFEGEQT